MLPPANQFNTPRHVPSPTATHAPTQIKQSPVVHYTFMLIGLSLLVFVLHKLDDLFLPLVYAVLLSLLLMPMVSRLEQWKWPRILAIATSLLVVIGGLALLFGFLGCR